MNSQELNELEINREQDAIDAKRYRWVRDHCTPDENPQHTWIVEAAGSEWDVAIDYAMAENENM